MAIQEVSGLPKFISQKDLAELLTISDRHVRRLEEQGVFKKELDGYPFPTCVHSYFEHRFPENDERQEERTRLENAKADEIEARINRKLENLVPVDEVVAFVGEILRITREEFDKAMPKIEAQIGRQIADNIRKDLACQWKNVEVLLEKRAAELRSPKASR